MRIKDMPWAYMLITLGGCAVLLFVVFVLIPPSRADNTPAIVQNYSIPDVGLSIVKMKSPRQGFDFECVVAEKEANIALSCNWP